MGDRPPVSVVVPFAGDRTDAERLGRALDRMELRDGDEVVVGDNSLGGVAAAAFDGSATVARAEGERSSYHARNTAAARATREWILFMDSDCVPDPRLLDLYFEDEVTEWCGALAGTIVPDPEQRALAARYARARNFVVIEQWAGVIPTAPTGNLMVRRDAFEEIGGFVEGIRSGGDVDLCRRLQEIGFSLEQRPAAIVVHPHSETLLGYLRIVSRYAGGGAWLDERYPGISPRWPLWPEALRAVRDSAREWGKGNSDEAWFRLFDGLSLAAHNVGYRSDNRAEPYPSRSA